MGFTDKVQISRKWLDAHQAIEDYLQSLATTCVSSGVPDASSPATWFATYFNSINPTRCDYLIVHTDADRIFMSTDGGTSWVEIFNITIISVETGMIIEYGGIDTQIPSGWQLCDGSAISRTTYADLFTGIGTTYGVGDGSTTFNLPDLRAKNPMGVNDSSLDNGEDLSLTTRNRADTGGTETIVLITDELPSHRHGGHRGGSQNTDSGAGVLVVNSGSTNVNATGGNTAHNNLQPSTTMNYLIKDGT